MGQDEVNEAEKLREEINILQLKKQRDELLTATSGKAMGNIPEVKKEEETPLNYVKRIMGGKI